MKSPKWSHKAEIDFHKYTYYMKTTYAQSDHVFISPATLVYVLPLLFEIEYTFIRY